MTAELGKLKVAFLGALFAGSWACHAPPLQDSRPPVVDVPSPSSSPEPPSEEARIILLVRDAYQAGLERHDAAAFMRIWAPKSTMTSARLEESGPYDVTLRRDQIESVRRLDFVWSDGLALRIANAEVTIEGAHATLGWRATVARSGAADVFEERYQLEKTPAGWRVTAMRYWPVAMRLQDRRVVFNRRYFEELDEKIERTRAEGDERNLLYQLSGSYRFAEASALARRLSEDPDADAWVWAMRESTSLSIGDAQDAELSRERRTALGDPGDAAPPDAP